MGSRSFYSKTPSCLCESNIWLDLALETSNVNLGSKISGLWLREPIWCLAFGPAIILAPKILNLARIWILRIPTFCSPVVNCGYVAILLRFCSSKDPLIHGVNDSLLFELKISKNLDIGQKWAQQDEYRHTDISHMYYRIAPKVGKIFFFCT